MTRQATTRVRTLAIALAAFGIATAVQAAPLEKLPPATWGCELGNEKVLLGINAGLISRDWRLTANDDKGHLVAKFVKRGKHTLIVDISYTDTTYEIAYKSSDNLKYKVGDDGTPQIHNNANKWMRKLHEAIGLQLAGICRLTK
jgi:hypothetical protein